MRVATRAGGVGARSGIGRVAGVAEFRGGHKGRGGVGARSGIGRVAGVAEFRGGHKGRGGCRRP